MASAAPDLPLYQQVLHALRKDIVSGTVPVGAQMPTEAVLCRRFKVSRYTIREALRQLRDDGLILSRRGAGTTVAATGTSAGYVHTIGSIQDLVSYAQETRYAIDESRRVVADAALAHRLGCAVGQAWLRITGLRYAPGQDIPFCWTEVYVHEDYSGITRVLARRSGPIYGWIEDLYGERIAEIEQMLSARDVPEDVALSLQADPRVLGIEIRRAYRLSSGVVAEVAFNLHPANRFRHVMTLRRDASAGRTDPGKQ
jgi:GntR family transcriptional regulator